MKLHGLDNKYDISNILQKKENLKNFERICMKPGEIGRLNSIKMELEKEIEKRMKMIGHCDSILLGEDKKTT